jgi:hypothetical protein
MTCPDCGRRLIIAIYAICTYCKVAYQPHELVDAQTRVSKAEAEKRA